MSPGCGGSCTSAKGANEVMSDLAICTLPEEPKDLPESALPLNVLPDTGAASEAAAEVLLAKLLNETGPIPMLLSKLFSCSAATLCDTMAISLSPFRVTGKLASSLAKLSSEGPTGLALFPVAPCSVSSLVLLSALFRLTPLLSFLLLKFDKACWRAESSCEQAHCS